MSICSSYGTPVTWKTLVDEADKVSVQGHGTRESIQRAQDSAIVLAEQALAVAPQAIGTEDSSTAYILNHLARYHCLLGNLLKADSLWHRADTLLAPTGESSELRDEVLLSLSLITPMLPDTGFHPYDHQKAMALMDIVLRWTDTSATRLSWKLVQLSYLMGFYEYTDRFARNALFAYQNRGGDAYSAMRGVIHQAEQLSKLLNSNTPNTRKLQDSAVTLGKLALGIVEGAYGQSDTSVAFVLQRLGDYQMRQGDRLHACSSWDRAWQINKEALPPEHIEYQGSVDRMGTVCRFRGEYLEAERMRRLALELRIKVQGSAHPETAAMYMNLGNLYHEMGKYAGAEQCYQSALNIRTHAVEHIPEDIAQCYSHLASLASDQGQPVQAYANITLADSICRSSLGEDHLYSLDLRCQMAQLNLEWGNDSVAAQILSEILIRRETFLGKNHPSLVSDLFELAGLYASLHQMDLAAVAFENAVRITEQSLEPHGFMYAQYLNTKGNVALAMNHVNDALASFRNSLDIIDSSVHPPDVLLLSTLICLGGAMELADIPGAESMFQRAERIVSTLHTSRIIEVTDALDRLARYYLTHQQPDRAFEMARSAYDRRIQVFRDGARMLSELEAVRFQENVLTSRDLMISSHFACQLQDSTRLRIVSNAVIATKGWVVDDLFWRERLLASTADPAIRMLLDTLQEYRTRLSGLYVRSDDGNQPDNTSRSITEVGRRIEQIQLSVARLSAEYVREWSRGEFNSDSVQHALPAHSSLIEYFQFRDFRGIDSSYKYGMLCATSDTTFLADLGPSEIVDGNILRYRAHLDSVLSTPAGPSAQDVKEYRALASELAHVLLVNAEPVLNGCSTLFVSPDARIHSVAFAGLPQKEGYLIESHDIHYLASARSVGQSVPTSSNGLLALGDPDFDKLESRVPFASTSNEYISGRTDVMRGASDDCAALQSRQIGRLQGSRREVEQVAELWRRFSRQPAEVLLGSDASENNLRMFAPAFRVLHIATHAYAIDDSCNNVSLQLPSNDKGAMLSGLFLAGARLRSSDTRADGILTGTEISTLHLQGVKTVILSGCQTALGRIVGEGSAGLFRSFQRAGARTVIGSLWSVADNATAAFMSSLYSQPDLPLPQIMRHAMRDRLSELRKRGQPDHPALWAAFIATGEWSSLR